MKHKYIILNDLEGTDTTYPVGVFDTRKRAEKFASEVLIMPSCNYDEHIVRVPYFKGGKGRKNA